MFIDRVGSQQTRGILIFFNPPVFLRNIVSFKFTMSETLQEPTCQAIFAIIVLPARLAGREQFRGIERVHANDAIS